MPELSKVPRNWQTTAFFQRNTFKALGYMLGFSVQIALINLCLGDFIDDDIFKQTT